MASTKTRALVKFIYNNMDFDLDMLLERPSIENYEYIIYKNNPIWTDGDMKWESIAGEIRNFSPGAFGTIKKIAKNNVVHKFHIHYISTQENWILENCIVIQEDKILIFKPSMCRISN